MKITDITYEAVKIPYIRPFFPTWFPGLSEDGQTIFIVTVHTDEGICGWGTMEAPFGIMKIIMETLNYARTMVVGMDPFDIEKLMLRLNHVARIGTRPWIIENCCWDIMGKKCGQPVYKLMGAARDRIPVYAAWGEIRDNAQRKEDALRLAEDGFKAVKVRFSHDRMADDLAIVESVRDAVGDRLEIMVDANQGTARERKNGDFPVLWSYERAKATAKELEQLHCTWLEEPLHRYDFDNLARLCSEVDIPIAGAEINRGLHEFKTMLDKGCLDIYQPNCTMAASISDIRKIAVMADSCGRIVNPHAWIPGLGVLQTAHLAAAIPNFTYLEYPYDPPVLVPDTFQGILARPLFPEADGCIAMPDAPGFGIDLDEEKIDYYRIPLP